MSTYRARTRWMQYLRIIGVPPLPKAVIPGPCCGRLVQTLGKVTPAHTAFPGVVTVPSSAPKSRNHVGWVHHQIPAPRIPRAAIAAPSRMIRLQRRRDGGGGAVELADRTGSAMLPPFVLAQSGATQASGAIRQPSPVRQAAPTPAWASCGQPTWAMAP